MPTLPNIGLITPTLGGDAGVWDDKINACFALLDAHDHTSGKGVAITPAAIDIDDDLDMAGNALVNVDQLEFTARAVLAAGSNIFFVNTSDNELYFRSSGGVNIQITNAGALDISGVGGIAGDYASVGAEVAFSDADQVYTFKDQSSPSKKWARVACGPVRIYENDTTESVYVEITAPASLAGSYTVVLPEAVPATSARPVRMNTNGALTVDTPVRSYGIGGAAFTPLVAATFDGSGWTFGSAFSLYASALPVSEDDTIVSILFDYDRAGAGNVVLSLLRREVGTTNVTTVATHTINAGTGRTTYLLAVDHTVLSGMEYAILMSIDAAGLGHGCVLNAQLNT